MKKAPARRLFSFPGLAFGDPLRDANRLSETQDPLEESDAGDGKKRALMSV